MILASPERTEAVRAAAEAVTSDILELTAQISAVPSPTGEETAKSLLVERLFTNAGLATERDELGDIVATIPGRLSAKAGARRLVVAAHIDTVFPIGTPLEVANRLLSSESVRFMVAAGSPGGVAVTVAHVFLVL